MEPVRKIAQPRAEGLVDLQVLLNPTISISAKLQHLQKISDTLEDCCKNIPYFDNMINVFLKVLNIIDPVFSPDHDALKIRKLILQILLKVSSATDKIQNHVQNLMIACLKVLETDNEQCVIYCVMIFKELLNTFKPNFDGCCKAEVYKFFQLTMDMYRNSNTAEKIFNFRNTADIKTLMSTIRIITTLNKANVHYVFIPTGRVSFKIIKELAVVMKMYFMLYNSVESFKTEIIEFFPVLLKFFYLEIQFKSHEFYSRPEYRDLLLDLKFSQVRLLSFFAMFLKGYKNVVSLQFSKLLSRIIYLLNCNMASDVSSLRTELLTGFETILLLADYKKEFLPFMDTFLDENLITGRSWSLKQVLRFKAYIYIDHLITNLHSHLSLNFLVRVIHIHFSDLLDPTLEPDVQINLCSTVLEILSYIVNRQNESITNINTIENNGNPFVDLLFRVFQILVLKLKQFQKFYLPQLKEESIKEEMVESISNILAENQANGKYKEFTFGYHSSQIVPYSITDSKRFVKIIVPGIKNIFQHIASIEGSKSLILNYYRKSLNNFIKHSLLSVKIFNCPIKKKEIIQEVLSALLCISPIHLKIFIIGDSVIELVYDNNLESLVFDLALNDEVLRSIFGLWMLEYLLYYLIDKSKKSRIVDLIDRCLLYYKLNSNEEIVDDYICQIIKKLMENIQNEQYPLFYLEILKKILNVESTGCEFSENMRVVLSSLINDLFIYQRSLSSDIVSLKVALSELCLAECLLEIAVHSHLNDLLSVIAYSLKVHQLTLPALNILQKCFTDTFSLNNFDDFTLTNRNEIIKGLWYCLDNPSESIFQPALSLLGKIGGLNRSSCIKPQHLNSVEKRYQNSRKTKISVFFDGYTNNVLDIDIGPALNTAVETLTSKTERFYRTHSWNIIRGFLLVSMKYDTSVMINSLSKINWKIGEPTFLDSKLQCNETFVDESYVKALTGLIISCGDEHLKEESFKYLYQYIKDIVCIAVYQQSDIEPKLTLEAKLCVLFDAIAIVLSNEREKVSQTGILAIELVMRECHSFLGDNIVCLPFVTHMYTKFCQLSYDTRWTHKRGGQLGLQVYLSILLAKDTTEHTLSTKVSSWFINNLIDAFKAAFFIFSDFNGQLTFGALKLAQSNLDDIINWVYLRNEPDAETFVDLVQKSIFEELINHIVGPNDLLRNQSIRIVNLIAKKQQKTVLNILKPFQDNFILSIPGKQLFNNYTFKTQMGIMKGHIFCALYSIPPKKLDFTNKFHIHYFNTLCIVCKTGNEKDQKMKMFQHLTTKQLSEFQETAMQVLVNCLAFLKRPKKIEVFKVCLDALRSPNIELQEIAYQCLKSSSNKLSGIESMVEKLFLYYADLFKDSKNVTSEKTRCVLYLSKLFPSSQNVAFCTVLLNVFKCLVNDLSFCENKRRKNELGHILKNILEIFYLRTETKFNCIQEVCEIVFSVTSLDFELCNQFYPLLVECLTKFPENSLNLFFKEENLKNYTWSSFFHSMILSKKCKLLRNVLKSNSTILETLLLSAKTDPSGTVQYESIKIIYNLMKIEKQWINTSKKLVNILLNIWVNPSYKERYQNLFSIKSTEWDEPKMLLKILMTYFMDNIEEFLLLFHILPVLSYRLPVDINFIRITLETKIVNSFTIEWKRKVFFEFVDLYQKVNTNKVILRNILQFIILPCFAVCYKNGEKEKLLHGSEDSDENIIEIFLNKIFSHVRDKLNGCDYDGIKAFLCQFICLLIENLLNFNENVCDLLYNAVLSCTNVRSPMDTNVKYHCLLIMTYIMLSENSSKKEKYNNVIYYELLKGSSVEAQPVINYALKLIVTAVSKNRNEVNTLIVCARKILMSESQNVPTLHHICSFVIKNYILAFPYKKFLIRHIIGSLFPIARNNNVLEFKKTAIELACMIIKWELMVVDNNMKLNFPQKRTHDDVPCTTENNNSLHTKISTEAIDNALNFLAMVGCQTHDDKPESMISQLADRSAALFENILTSKAINSQEVKLKFGWIEKLLDTFLTKGNLVNENPDALGNTNASLMNVSTTFDIISFMLKVLSNKLMLDGLEPLQDHLKQFLQLVYKKTNIFNLSQNQKSASTNNQLDLSLVEKYNKGTLKVVTEILKTFASDKQLEKLHACIKSIISECAINKSCPHKLEISLTLLEAARKNFPNYMSTDVFSTLENIILKPDEYNQNPTIKIKCLEIINPCIDTVKSCGKEFFIEQIVMKVLDQARDSNNNIPVEVQIKCFEIIITYFQVIPEIIERILLKSTVFEYIRSTKDEKIMRAILNMIATWIEVCRNESVFFNKSVIHILKCAIFSNSFPNLIEYCYELNLKIYKLWQLRDCIEYGIDCKFPLLRNEFFNLFDSFWNENELSKRLCGIMSNDLNHNLDSPLAFYIQILLVKICQYMHIKGNFTFLKVYQLATVYQQQTSLRAFPLQTMFDICSSLTQLCYIDENLAKNLWKSLLPAMWNLFNNTQKKMLSERAVQFLEFSKLPNNFMIPFYEAIVLCEPKIYFEPNQIAKIGKTYNLWYQVIEQLENMYAENDRAIEVVIQLYSHLREEDVLEHLFQKTTTSDETIKALHLEQLGNIGSASQLYCKLLTGVNHKDFYSTNNYNKENELNFIRYTKCLRELGQWDYLSELIPETGNPFLFIENAWKTSTINLDYQSIRLYVEDKENIWPSDMRWKYHFYLGMWSLNEMDHQLLHSVKGHMNLAIKDIITQWKTLPKYICNAHIPLLQATQLIEEVREAYGMQMLLFDKSLSAYHVNTLIQMWNSRKPWIGDKTTVWSDLLAWRQTYYSFLISNDANSEFQNVKSAQVHLKLLLGNTALKHGMIGLCKKTLRSIDEKNSDSYNWLTKMYLETKCMKYARQLNKKLDDMTYSTDTHITNEVKPFYYSIAGSLHGYRKNIDKSFQLFTKAFTQNDDSQWQSVIDDNFRIYCTREHTQDKITPFICFQTILNSKEMLADAWLQWAVLIHNRFNQLTVKDSSISSAAIKCYIMATELTNKFKCNIIIARILSLLTFSDNNCTLLNILEESNIVFSDLWIPQMLNIFVQKNKSVLKRIISKIGKLYPQKVYLTLNRMYLSEKMNETEMEPSSSNSNENDDSNVSIEVQKVHKIKYMMNLLRKINTNTIQMGCFVDQMTTLEDSWDEELRRDLYRCTYLCYDYAFKVKNIKVRVPPKIFNFIETMSFVTQDVNSDKTKMKNAFMVPDNTSKFHQHLKKQFPRDFSPMSVPTVELMIKKLTIWIKLIEKKFDHQKHILRNDRYPAINNLDWSVIRLPNANINDRLKGVRIHSISHIRLRDKCGTTVKQLGIRGTDGLLYTYCISNGQDIESEERILQLFYVTNTYLLNDKETANRFLNCCIPRTFTLTPHLRMVETSDSAISLLEIYNEMAIPKRWIHDDINLWFSTLKSCIMGNVSQPLEVSYGAVKSQLCPDNLFANWVSFNYPSLCDYWEFRKTFIQHYSVLCFFEYVFSFIKLKPEMLNIDKNTGVATISFYKFLFKKKTGFLIHESSMPFRMTPNIQQLISPIRKNQMINCMTVTGLCLSKNIDDISVVLKLLLNEEISIKYKIDDYEENSKDYNQRIFNIVETNWNFVMGKLNSFKHSTQENQVPNLLLKAVLPVHLYHETPTSRPWL